jgi:hypothetical protein
MGVHALPDSRTSGSVGLASAVLTTLLRAVREQTKRQSRACDHPGPPSNSPEARDERPAASAPNVKNLDHKHLLAVVADDLPLGCLGQAALRHQRLCLALRTRDGTDLSPGNPDLPT